MRTSITTWVIAAMVALPAAAFAHGGSGGSGSGGSGSGNSGPNNAHGQIVNMNLNNLVAPAILNNSALGRSNAGGNGRGSAIDVGPSFDMLRPVGTGIGNRGPAGEVGRMQGGRDAFQNQDHQSRGRRDGAPKLDASDKKDGKTVEAADKSDGKNSAAVTRVAATTADEASPEQSSAARSNLPPPACR